MRYGTFKGLPRKDPRLTKFGSKTLLNSSPKWFKMSNPESYHSICNNGNLYGFEVFTNDGLRGCLISKDHLFKSLQMGLIELKRRG